MSLSAVRPAGVVLGLMVAITPALGATAASAQVEGPCAGAIAGADPSQISTPETAIEVDQFSPLPIAIRSEDQISSRSFALELAGLRWTLSDVVLRKKASPNGFIHTERSTRYTAGIFKVVATAVGPSGSCTISGYVELVGKNPLTTVAGGAGAVATGGGLIALALAFVFGSRRQGLRAEREVWEAGRARWRPAWSFGPVAGGLLVAFGVLVLLQQHAVVYPTRMVALLFLLLGLATGVAVASVAALAGVRRANREAEELGELGDTDGERNPGPYSEPEPY